MPASAYERLQGWLWRHKILTGVVVLATGTVAYRSYRRSRFCRKTRRAKRARTGGRLEVVVIAGSPALPLTKSLALDLERKGFIVYIVCNAMEDEVLVQALSRPDIRPLSIDITDVCQTLWQECVCKVSLTCLCSLPWPVRPLTASHSIYTQHTQPYQVPRRRT